MKDQTEVLEFEIKNIKNENSKNKNSNQLK